MKKAILAAVLAAIFSGIALLAIPALATNVKTRTTIDPCYKKYSFHEFRDFTDGVWRFSAWDRAQNRKGLPPPHTLAQGMLMRQCARSDGHRRKMAKYWKKAKKAFYAYRADKIVWLKQIQYMKAVIAPLAGILATIRACESGTSGGYSAVSADGSYRGAYQFDYRTWESVGGTGDPAAASPLEQDYRAAILYNRSGSSPWPICGV